MSSYEVKTSSTWFTSGKVQTEFDEIVRTLRMPETKTGRPAKITRLWLLHIKLDVARLHW